MKNLSIILLLNLFLILIGCDTDSVYLEKDNVKTIESIANKYGYKVSNLNPNDSVFKVSDLNELESLLESIKYNFETPKTVSFGNSYNNNTLTVEQQQEILDLQRELSLKKKDLTQNKSAEDDDPPYTYSTTVYFNNTFPCSNVYITINYNTNSMNQIIAAEVVTGTWGYSFGNTYTQTNVNSILQNGIFVFNVTGQFSTTIGIGSFSLTNSNFVNFTGCINNFQNGSGGFVRQEGGDDRTELQNN